MNNKQVNDLLEELSSARASPAWTQFLQVFSSTIVAVVRQYEHAEQGLEDGFLFVCEKLSDNQFRRLTAWKEQEGVAFAGWLRAVVSRLCVDWYRKQHGRPRPFRSIAKLSELEKQVYHCRFQQGMSIQSCQAELSARYTELTEIRLAGIIRKLNVMLTPRQHWLLSVRQSATMSLESIRSDHSSPPALINEETPAAFAASEETSARLETALTELTDEQQLLLKLRYRHGLALKEVARLVGLDDLFKARYQIRLALDRLAHLLGTD
jgi:RNA polymerase sigma factor (sigma-70 family)